MNTNHLKVMIVEDDVDLRESMEECLGLMGFSMTGVGTALEFFQKLATGAYDVVVIDVGLPDQEGFEIASLLAGRPEMGVVLLTARSSSEDRIRGFRSGADLYFVKPIDCRELAAGLQALARRLTVGRDGATADAEVEPAVWSLDQARWLLVSPAGREVSLTSSEMRLLEALVREPGATVSRNDLLDVMGYRPDESGNRNLDALIWRLRRKVEQGAEVKAPIQTVHNRGYLFSGPLRAGRSGRG